MLQKTILGTMLLGGKKVAKDFILNLSEDFFSKKDKVILQLIREKTSLNEDFDSTLIAEELQEAKLIENPYSYVTLLADSACPVSLLPIYIKKLKNKIAKLKVLNIANQNGDLEQISKIIKGLEDSIQIQESKKVMNIKGIMQDLKYSMNNGNGIEFKFKFLPLKNMLVGLDRGTLTIIGGWTSQAKSSLCLKLAMEFAEDNHKVLFCSSEMTEFELGKRIIAHKCYIDSMRFKELDFSKEEKEIIEEEISKIDISLWIARISRVVEVERIIRELKPDIVFVDHIHQIVGPGKNEYEMVSNIILELKNIAMEKDIALIAVSQLHRKEKESLRKPRLSDLRSSGKIEENANNVILLYWAYPITGDEKKKNNIEIKIAKSRDGEIGTDKNIIFKPEFYEFIAK